MFSFREYPAHITQTLETHFQEELDVPFSLVPYITRGATKTYYYRLTLPWGEFFVKYGEKVLQEIKCQLQFGMDNTLSFPPLSRGTSIEKGILVRPFLSDPGFGYQLVDRLYDGSVSLEEFLAIQDEIFEKIKNLYTLSYSPETKSTFFTIRLLDRMSTLLADPALNDFLDETDLDGLKQEDLFTLPIIYQKQVWLPPIVQMVTNFAAKFEKIPELSNRYLVHGDLHPPNIARDKIFGIVMIDLSDIKMHEDPCWDLGKWLNHIHRLHPVVKKRDSSEIDREISLKKTEKGIELEDCTIYPKWLREIDLAAITKIADILGEPIDLIRVRVKAAEFVANINTLKRHIEQFPNMTKRLLCIISDSYIDWNNEAEHYFPSTTLKN